MTGSRADFRVLAVVLALVGLPASAQQPIQLVPPPQPYGQPQTSPAAAPAQPQPSQRMQDFYGGPVSSGGQLAPVDNASIGIVDTRASGLPAELWRGTDRGSATQLIEALPGAPRSRILRDLQFRLLTMIAVPPLGANAPGKDYVSARVAKLAEMGEVEAVGQMTQAAGPMSGDAAQRLNIENQINAGDLKSACATPMAQNSPDPFWYKLLIMCQVVSGQGAQAMLNVDLLRERGVADTGFFVAVDYALGTRTAKPPANIGTDSLSQALLRASNPRAATLGNETSPSQLRQIAANIAAPLAMRIEAAERGEALGVIDPRHLLELYQAGADAPGLSPQVKRRAQAVRDALKAEDLGEKVKSMQAAFRAAEGSALFTTMSRVLGEQLVKIFPEHKTAPMAADTARAFLALNDFSRSVEWYYTVAGGSTIDPQYATPTAQLWPVMQLADNAASIPWEPGFMTKWQGLNAKHPRAAQRAAVLGAMLTALGEPVDRGEFNPPLPPQGFAAVPQQALSRLAQSAQSGKVGETIALAAQAAGETNLTQLPPATLAAIIQALRQAGLPDVARRFAVEVALAHAL